MHLSLILHTLSSLPQARVLVVWLGLSIGLSMLIHELGHFAAARICRVRASEIGLGLGPKLWWFKLGSLTFSLRIFLVASFLRLDGAELKRRPLTQQMFIHLGGVLANLMFGLFAYGTLFGWINLLLAAANLLPLYQHDGWKCGVAIVRALLGRTSQPVEWVFTFSGAFASLVIVAALVHGLG